VPSPWPDILQLDRPDNAHIFIPNLVHIKLIYSLTYYGFNQSTRFVQLRPLRITLCSPLLAEMNENIFVFNHTCQLLISLNTCAIRRSNGLSKKYYLYMHGVLAKNIKPLILISINRFLKLT